MGLVKEPTQAKAVHLGFVKATVWFVLPLFFKENKQNMYNQYSMEVKR